RDIAYGGPNERATIRNTGGTAGGDTPAVSTGRATPPRVTFYRDRRTSRGHHRRRRAGPADLGPHIFRRHPAVDYTAIGVPGPRSLRHRGAHSRRRTAGGIRRAPLSRRAGVGPRHGSFGVSRRPGK